MNLCMKRHIITIRNEKQCVLPLYDKNGLIYGLCSVPLYKSDNIKEDIEACEQAQMEDSPNQPYETFVYIYKDMVGIGCCRYNDYDSFSDRVHIAVQAVKDMNRNV